MKKLTPILLVLSFLLNVGLIYLFIFKGETVKSTDNRVAIALSENNKDFVLAEMRGFLESVQKINEGILNNNPELVIAAGEKSGGSVISHSPKGLMKSLPKEFKTLGFSTHGIFDDIVKNATERFKPKETQQQLNSLLNSCVACHKSYKVVPLTVH